MGALSGVASTSEFISLADSIYAKRGRGSGYPPMRMFLLQCKIRPEEFSSVSKVDDKFSIRVLRRIDDDLTEFGTARHWAGKTQETTSFLLRCKKGWLVLHTGSDASLVRGALYRLQPLVTPVRFFSSDFLRLTERLSECEGRFEIKEAMLKDAETSTRVQKRGRKRRHLTPNRSITPMQLEDLVEKGNARAKRLGIKESDVPKLIHKGRGIRA